MNISFIGIFSFIIISISNQANNQISLLFNFLIFSSILDKLVFFLYRIFLIFYQ